MGCDIHLFVEAKKDGKWESADSWELDGDYEPPEFKVPYGKRFYDGRNYNLFSILANVRNGYGFAGCKTGEGFVPISMPKGIPDDASERVSAGSESWGDDGHSHSWLTLREIFEYDWTRVTKLRGFVDALAFRDWVNRRKELGEGPESYCGGVGGGSVEIVSHDEMASRIKVIETREKNYQQIVEAIKKEMPYVYTNVEWDVPYWRCASEFWGTAIPRLIRLGDFDSVRIVFWFDN